MAKFAFQGRTSFLWKLVLIYFLMNIFYCSGQINLKHRTENDLEQKYSSLEQKDIFLSKLLPTTSRSAFDHVTELPKTRELTQYRLGRLNDRYDRKFHPFGHFKDEISPKIYHGEFTKNKRSRQKRAVSWRPTDLQNLKDVFFMVFNRTEMKMNKFANQLSQLVETANEKNRQLKMDFLPRLENIEQRLTLVHSVDCKEKDAERFRIFNNFSLEFNEERDQIRQELLEWSEIAMICKLPLDEPYGENSETLLHIAAQVDAAEAAKLLIRAGAKIHSRTVEEITPLHLAARNNSIQILNLLIENHADVDAIDMLGETALFEAAATDTVEAAQILIQNKADVNAYGFGGLPIHKAASRNSVKVLKLLIEHKASVNEPSLTGTPLHQTIEGDAVEAAEILLENGANLTLTSLLGDTVLHRAARENCVKLMQLFLKKYKGLVNIRNDYGYTPLHSAAVKNSRAVAEILLENGADIKSGTAINSTPLHLAAENNAIDVVKLLLENGANINSRTGSKSTPLHLAAENKAIDVVKLLLENGADINCRTRSKYTPLHLATENKAIDVVKLLLENGADINSRTTSKSTPLHLAAENKAIDIVKLLLENGADINSRTTSNSTPLHLATENKAIDVVKLLLENKANTKIADYEGLTPYGVARKHKCKQCLKIMKTFGVQQ